MRVKVVTIVNDGDKGKGKIIVPNSQGVYKDAIELDSDNASAKIYGTDIKAALDGKAPTSHSHTLASLGAAAASHSHTIAQVTSLQASLDGKAASSHNHSAADITSGTLPIARGGTAATTAADARTNLGIIEGTFTPRLIGGVSDPTVSYIYQYGWYYKIGHLVIVQIYIEGNIGAAGSGGAYIGGLPYACCSTPIHAGNIHVGGFGTNSAYGYSGYFGTNTAWIRITTPTGGNINWLPNAGGTVRINATYRTNS